MNFFDLHCDTPYECYTKNQEFKSNTLAVSSDKGVVFDKWYQTFAIWIKDDTEKPFELYKNILKDFKKKLNCSSKNLTPIFAVEGGAVIENDTDRLYQLKNDGIRFLTLTWNGENRIAGGINSDSSLTDFGEKVIEKMNRLKIACDLSHLNEKSFLKAIQLAENPIATHSNCKAVFEHPRNLSDTQIKLIAQKGGIIGLCPYPQFLGGEVFYSMYRNILHILRMGFEDNIAIGSDFDGAKMDSRLDSIDKIPDLYTYLREKGLEIRLLNKFFFENANNFIAKL